jgi:hypothetical protein
VTTQIDQFGPEQLRARMEIMQRVYQFGRAVDRLDLASARDSFHPEAIDNHGAFHGDIDGLLDWVRGRHQTLPFSYHHIGNIFIEFASVDDAFVESSVFAWQSVSPEGWAGDEADRPDKMFEMAAPGRYVDHWTRRDGEWRILKRVTIVESTMVVPAEGKIEFPSDWPQGSRDLDDPSQQLRSELGLAVTTDLEAAL